MADWLKKKASDLVGFAGKTKWVQPVVDDDTRDETYKKMIFLNDEMVNAMELTGKEWLSTQKRFFPKDAYFVENGIEYLKTGEVVDRNTKGNPIYKFSAFKIKPGTKKYYSASTTGALGKKGRKGPRPPIHAANRIREADRLQALRDQDFKLDLTMYQMLLADPKTNQRAVEELRFIQALIDNEQKLSEAQLEEKLRKSQLASQGLGLIGTALGAAAGITSIGTIAQGSASQALKITESVVDKLGKTAAVAGTAKALYDMKGVKTQANLDAEKMMSLNQSQGKLALKTATDVAMKTAGLVILGVAANLTAPGAAVTALAIVTTAAKAGVNMYSQHLEKKKMMIKMNKNDLLNSIDEMIVNRGTIFYKEDNPMFQDSVVIKNKVNSILNMQENFKVFDEVAALENSIRAAAILDEMIEYSADKYNSDFNNEIEKLRVLEKKNNASLQKLRNRRTKLKRMYNTYKKPLLQKNITNSLATNLLVMAGPPPAAAAAARRATRKLRK
jgi:hypothetical protein